jgi:hypothetical protein
MRCYVGERNLEAMIYGGLLLLLVLVAKTAA